MTRPRTKSDRSRALDEPRANPTRGGHPMTLDLSALVVRVRLAWRTLRGRIPHPRRNP